jgi:lipopolysaccharide export system protein LptA
MRARITTALGFVATMAASAAWAQPSVSTGGFRNADPEAPVEVTSDRLDLTRDAGTALFTGNVIAIQGEMRLSAEWVLVEYVVLEDGSLGSDIQTITAKDNVVLVTPEEAAEGDNAVYTPLTNLVVMTGNVLLPQGSNTVAGNRLTVNLETGIGEVEGRVRTVLQPGSENQ